MYNRNDGPNPRPRGRCVGFAPVAHPAKHRGVGGCEHADEVGGRGALSTANCGNNGLQRTTTALCGPWRLNHPRLLVLASLPTTATTGDRASIRQSVVSVRWTCRTTGRELSSVALTSHGKQRLPVLGGEVWLQRPIRDLCGHRGSQRLNNPNTRWCERCQLRQQRNAKHESVNPLFVTLGLPRLLAAFRAPSLTLPSAVGSRGGVAAPHVSVRGPGRSPHIALSYPLESMKRSLQLPSNPRQ